MARKRYSDEDVLKLLGEIDVYLHDGLDVLSVCRKAGISDKSYYYWRGKLGKLFIGLALIVWCVRDQTINASDFILIDM